MGGLGDFGEGHAGVFKEKTMTDAQDYSEVMSNILKVDGVAGCQMAEGGGFYVYSKPILNYRDMEKTLSGMEVGIAAVVGHEICRHNIVFRPVVDCDGFCARWWVS